ncbi:MAG: transposase [Clostridia bacterium]|nr:transposase [Clostridia bacterium]
MRRHNIRWHAISTKVTLPSGPCESSLIQVQVLLEGVFGIEKQDYRYTRTRRRGLEKVSTEMMLMFLGLNIKRLLKYYQTGKKLSFWKAPSDLGPESFKNPSAKRLSRKGEKLHDNIYK